MKRLSLRSGRRAPQTPVKKLFRLPRFEQLEDRRVLAAPTLASILLPPAPSGSPAGTPPDVLLGAPMPFAMQGSDADGDALTYTLQSSSTALKVQTTSKDNRTLKIVMDGFGPNGTDGEIWIQLFEDLAPATTKKIIGLVQQQPGFYNGKTFQRIIEDFMIQGGGQTGSGKKIDDEFHRDLQFTRDGILAMANAGDDTGDNQFFITDVPTRWLDFQHTIFGFVTRGDDVRKAVQATGETQRIQLAGNPAGGTWSITFNGVTTTALAANATAAQVQTALNALSSIGGTSVEGNVTVTSGGSGIYNVKFGSGLSTTDVPLMTVKTAALSPATTASITEVTKGFAPKMKTVTVITDKQDAVGLLKLESVPTGNTPITVTVRANDGKGSPDAVQTFKVTPKADTSNAPPFMVTPIDPIKTPLNTPVTYQIAAKDVENDKIIYDAALKTANSKITVSASRDLGKVTITPKNGVQGVFELIVKAGRTETSGTQTTDVWDTQSVVLCIGPAAPTGLTLLTPAPDRDSNITRADNSSSAKALKYRMSGLQGSAQATVLVVLYADGVEIGRGTSTGATLDLTSNGQHKLTPGPHSMSVKQTLLNQTVKVGNTDTTTDIPGAESAAAVNFVEGTVPGTSTAAIYDPSTSHFHLRNSNTTGVEDKALPYGEVSATSPWKPVSGDWNGDGVETIGLYNPANGVFYLKDSNQSGYADRYYGFGPKGNNWTPIAGDWNGDGIDTWGLYDPATSVFYLRNTRSSGAAEVVFAFGQPGAGWKPIVGDWNGDKTDTVGLYSPSGERYYLRNSNSAGFAEIDFVFATGAAGTGTIPVAGDFNADGKDSVAVYNPAKSEWRLKNDNTTAAAVTTMLYGNKATNLVPVAGDWDALTASASSNSALLAAEDNPSTLDDNLLDTLAGA